MKDKKYPLRCPNDKCKVELSMADISEFLDRADLLVYLDYSFKHEVEANPAMYSFCPTPDCTYVFVWDKDEDDNDFSCPVCEEHYCLSCRCIFHTDMTCEEYRRSARGSVHCHLTHPSKLTLNSTSSPKE